MKFAFFMIFFYLEIREGFQKKINKKLLYKLKKFKIPYMINSHISISLDFVYKIKKNLILGNQNI